MAKEIAYTYDIYIAAPPAKVWKGIADGEMTKHYVYGTAFVNHWIAHHQNSNGKSTCKN